LEVSPTKFLALEYQAKSDDEKGEGQDKLDINTLKIEEREREKKRKSMGKGYLERLHSKGIMLGGSLLTTVGAS
jgi:hypothetical protein